MYQSVRKEGSRLMNDTDTTSMNSLRRISISGLLFKFILLDVLFLPYPPGIPITFSVIAVIIWPILTLDRFNRRYLALSTVLIVLIVISFFRFLAFSPTSSSIYLVPNVVNAGILSFMALLATMIVSKLGSIRNKEMDYSFILLVLKGYILFKSVLALYFFLSPSGYFRIRSFWTQSGNTIEIADLSVITRFTGTLSDPNNFGCILAAVVAFVIFRQPSKTLQNYGILFLASISIVASMSVTAIFAFLIVTLTYVALASLPGKLGTRLLLRMAMVLLTPIIFFVVWHTLKDNIVVQLALQRITDSSAESRLSKFLILTDLEKILPALLIGEGATIIWNGEIFRPHIGHIYLILGYGLPAYILFLLLFFPFSIRVPLALSVFLAPIFLGFSLNVGIYEPRFAGIWALLAGLYFIESKTERKLRRRGSKTRASPVFAETRLTA